MRKNREEKIKIMKKNLILPLIIGIVIVICAFHFFKKQTQQELHSSKFSIILLTQEGGIADKSFNEGVWSGLLKAKNELSAEISYIETEKEADFGDNLRRATDQKPSLILCIGFKFASLIKEEAENNPNQKYVLLDCSVDSIPPNLACITFKEHEVAFLAGILAGNLTQSNKVAFIGGMHAPAIERFKSGFEAGVKHIATEKKQEIEVLVQFAGTFTDTAKGKDLATVLIAEGCDVLFHAAGFAGSGAIEAAKEQNCKIIGVDTDQSCLAPQNVIASAAKKVDVAIFDLVRNVASGKQHEFGSEIIFGVKENGVDLIGISANIPNEVLQKLEETKQKFIDGDLVVSEME